MGKTPRFHPFFAVHVASSLLEHHSHSGCNGISIHGRLGWSLYVSKRHVGLVSIPNHALRDTSAVELGGIRLSDMQKHIAACFWHSLRSSALNLRFLVVVARLPANKEQITVQQTQHRERTLHDTSGFCSSRSIFQVHATQPCVSQVDSLSKSLEHYCGLVESIQAAPF